MQGLAELRQPLVGSFLDTFVRSEPLRTPQRPALVFAAAAFTVGLGSTNAVSDSAQGLIILSAVLIALPVLLVSTRPLMAWRAAAAATVVIPLMLHFTDTDPWRAPVVLGLVLIATLGAVSLRGDRSVTFWAWGTTSAVFLPLCTPDVRLGWSIALSAVVAAGDSIVARGRAREELSREREESELERARRTVLQQRTDIARDLHDVVAHRMSLVVVRAQTAQYRVPGLQPEAVHELDEIAVTAREALEEVRGLLGVLRSTGGEVLTAPQPGVAQVEQLVEQAREAGVGVTLSVEGAAREVRPVVDVGAYRILQESLANVARHAPGASAVVVVAYAEAELIVRVADDGPGTDPRSAERPGHGIVGMRERTAAAGGTLFAGPRPGGGFEVIARLPLSALVEQPVIAAGVR